MIGKKCFYFLAQLLAEALDSSIAPLDELGQNQPIADDFGFLQKMLLYQIADLHQMKVEGVLAHPPHILWLGASHKGETTWYNFQHFTIS